MPLIASMIPHLPLSSSFQRSVAAVHLRTIQARHIVSCIVSAAAADAATGTTATTTTTTMTEANMKSSSVVPSHSPSQPQSQPQQTPYVRQAMVHAQDLYQRAVDDFSHSGGGNRSSNVISKDSKADATTSVTPPRPVEPLESRTLATSLSQLVVPLADDPALFAGYVSIFGHIRRGVLMEDMDAFAGLVSYKHVAGMCSTDAAIAPPPEDVPILVTASCDSMRMHAEPDHVEARQNLQMVGAVTHVGRSSMNVEIDVATVAKVPTAILSASFTFVARDKKTGRSVQVPRLHALTEEQIRLRDAGAEKAARRREARQDSLLRTPPTSEELAIIHKLFLRSSSGGGGGYSNGNSGSGNGSDDGRHNTLGLANTTTAAAATVNARDTERVSTFLCQPQVKNAHGKVFGGYLMRKAFELAWTTVHTNSGGRVPRLLATEDIFFVAPVEIGSIVELTARMVYAAGCDSDAPRVSCTVRADVISPKSGARETTNTFEFVFELSGYDMRQGSSDSSSLTPPPTPVPEVLPSTYEEAMQYLMARRRQAVVATPDTPRGSDSLLFAPESYLSSTSNTG